jgi:uncharacterized cofD-like protein
MQKKKIATIGGGTGSFMLLSGLKKYQADLSAVVSMADDGGSTGVLRDELGVLPPGDVRQCLVALSDSSEILRKLLSYRFEEGGLKGHSFGNLFLSALEKISGSFSGGLDEAMKILNVRGQVVPVTDQDAKLYLELEGGKILKGENEINHSSFGGQDVKKMYFSPKIGANKKALRCVKEADIIVIGPGNHYCSILPNLIIKDFAEAIRRSKAKVIYNCNLTNKKGHTEGFDVDDYAESINRIIGKDRIDYVIFNTKKPGKKLMEKYRGQEGGNFLVGFSAEKNPKRKFKVIKGDFILNGEIKYPKSDAIASIRSFIRHDSDKLAKAIMLISEVDNYRNIIKEIV